MQTPAEPIELANVNLSLKYIPVIMMDGAIIKPHPTPENMTEKYAFNKEMSMIFREWWLFDFSAGIHFGGDR